MIELRCPRCGKTRYEIVDNVIIADQLFIDNKPQCDRCGFAFNANPDKVAA